MNDKLLELEIEIQDIVVELNDRAQNDFDKLVVKRLNEVLSKLRNKEAL